MMNCHKYPTRRVQQQRLCKEHSRNRASKKGGVVLQGWKHRTVYTQSVQLFQLMSIHTIPNVRDIDNADQCFYIVSDADPSLSEHWVNMQYRFKRN